MCLNITKRLNTLVDAILVMFNKSDLVDPVPMNRRHKGIRGLDGDVT